VKAQRRYNNEEPLTKLKTAIGRDSNSDARDTKCVGNRKQKETQSDAQL
jgi:hypothetical protein